MKSLQLMAAPAVKLQIGKNNSVTIDTASNQNGQKTFNVSVTTDDDSISKTIDEVVNEVKDEMQHQKTFTIQDDRDFKESHSALEDLKGIVVPSILFVVLPLIVFAYLAYNAKQKRLLKESMIKNGMTPPEETSQINKLFEKGSVSTFEERKYLKYTIVALSFGISIILSNIIEKVLDIDIFFGLLALCLGLGFFYLYRKTNASNTNNNDTNTFHS